MSTSESHASKERAQAYLEWVQSVGEQSQAGVTYSKSVGTIDDLCDGAVLFDIMSSM